MTHRCLAWTAPLLAIALAAVACSDDSGSSEDSTADTGGDQQSIATCPTEGEEWEEAKLYIEHNATDEDTGVHGLFGGEAWSELCIVDPDGRQILVTDPQEQLGDLTVSDLFFESREPPADEYGVEDLEADFPEGEYRVSGTDFEGTARVGSAVFSHDIPAEPTIVAPALAEEAETAGDATVPATGLVVEWDEVTETIDGDPVIITGYEVIVTQEEFEDPNGFSRPVYDVHVPADRRSLSVPDDFFEPGTIYELEVLALEESGNQTISVGFFRTA
jgi:hypothetical protein